MARLRCRFDDLYGLLAGGRGQDVHPPALQHAAQRENVARIVVHQQHRLPDQIFVGAVEPFQHALLFRRQVGHHAMQEQRRFVEQPLRRFDAFHHDAACHGVDPGVLLGRQLPPGEDDDRESDSAGSTFICSSTSKPDMSGSRRSSTTQSAVWSRSDCNAPTPGCPP